MRKLSSIILILFLCQGIAYTQSVDVLKQKLEAAQTDTARVKLLAKLGFEYAFINLKSSRNYCHAAIELAERIQFTRGQADGLNNLAISYDVEGNHEVAVGYFLEALKLYEQINEKEGLARIYNNCGMVYQSLGDISKSLEYHNKSLEIETALVDSIGIAYSVTQIAALYLLQGDYEQALDHYAVAQNILEILGDDSGLSYVHWGLGELFLYTKDFEKALEHSEQAFALFEYEENKKGMAETLLIIGKTHLLRKDLTVAEHKLLRALAISEDLDAKNVTLECLLSLFELHKSKRLFESALSYHERYTILKDTLLKNEMTSNIKEIELKYDFEKQEQQIESLNRDNEYQTRIRNVFIGVAVVITLLLGLLYRAYSILKSKNVEIEQKNVFIEIERKNALAAAQAKSDFLSVMSHEIRTPLNIVIGYTHWLMESNPRPDQKESLDLMKFSADNLLALINDILDLNRLESNNLEIESIPFDLAHLIQNIWSGHKKPSEEKGLMLFLKMDKNIPSKVIGDPGRLSQVLNNLISNSIKFTENGTVELNIELLEKGLQVVRLKFSIDDTGIGVSEDKREHIFENFAQADSSTGRKYGGSGLGLSITRRILQHLGSDIHCESELGIGSTFHFELSLKLDHGQND